MRRTTCLALPALIFVLALAGVANARIAEDGAPRAAAPAAKLVKTLKTQAFGKVLVTLGNRALYYWTPEKRQPGKIFCTGACARAWPVLYVPKGAVVPRKLPGISGTFGTIRRPDGRRQLTHNRRPVYTYAHEGPRQVLCDDVDGWFVVRV